MTTQLPRIPRVDEMNHADLPEELQYNGYWAMRSRAKEIGNQSKIYYALSAVKDPPPKLLKGIKHFKRKLEDLEDIYKEMGDIQKKYEFEIVPFTGPEVEFDSYSKEGDRLNTHLNTVYREMCNKYPALRKICDSIEFAKQRKLVIDAELYHQKRAQQASDAKRDKRQTKINERRGTTTNRADSSMQTGKTLTASNTAVGKQTLFGLLFGKGKKSKKSKKTYKKSKTHKRNMH